MVGSVIVIGNRGGGSNDGSGDLNCGCKINRRAAMLSWGKSGIKRRHETGGEGLAVQRRDGGMISRCKRFGRRRGWGAIEAVVVTGPSQWICLHDETQGLDALSGPPNPPDKSGARWLLLIQVSSCARPCRCIHLRTCCLGKRELRTPRIDSGPSPLPRDCVASPARDWFPQG
ncbi:hypothetical protein M441DRAFT_249224 [Trichoderma asperellum CBS 433.97]|uniref:Uncharacterized protein n=1 Tax=Trichoderma asperellum (strain ATCC 204424 / CBS 433.97 / NBRC 101777) TaxID=1042311 RepID=A0A2T3Z0D7_TRIA4|nr:hypothetical protein M441DRAFT_249224 [Trichoderma asperellum CBS 433.97]PTB38257.1 hypothetical protein M441DRAFT_249224 [Trichoderma asperellum CBS 433.97]